jgi:hypothetical protein
MVKIKMLKEFPDYAERFGGWKEGDKLTLRSANLKYREDKLDKWGLECLFEEVGGKYWLPFDWFETEHKSLKILLDE